MIILFKYCANMENCESFRGFDYIYIYIYISKTFNMTPKHYFSQKFIL